MPISASAATLTLPPSRFIDGHIRPPGSKSISNRVLPLAALAHGTTRIHNLLESDDVNYMRQALAQLGISLQFSSGEAKVVGLGGPIHSPTPQSLFVGNAGTAMRILSALLCAGKGEFLLDGVPRMRERPIGDLVNALTPLAGATRISYTGQPGFPPLSIHAQGLEGGRTSIRGSISSQFLTGLLMALPFCRKPVEVHVEGELVSQPYVKLTLALMRRFGVEVEQHSYQVFRLSPPQAYHSVGDFYVEADASSASYFLAAAAIARGIIRVEGLGKNSLQGEAGFARVLEQMGAQVRYQEDAITVSGAPLRGVDVDMDSMSDTGMTLAIAALFAEGPTTIRNIGNWRVKETDRIAAMAAELRKVGATVEEGSSYLTIHPPEKLLPAVIETYDDHRMAMCFSLVCLGGVPVTLIDPDCTSKTYPGYFLDFNSLLQADPPP